MSDRLIGITEDYLQEIIAAATAAGYAKGREEYSDSEWLTSRAEICAFLGKNGQPISVSTFNRQKAAGVYGCVIHGRGASCKAKKTELLEAIKNYEWRE